MGNQSEKLSSPPRKILFSPNELEELRGSIVMDHTYSKHTSKKLREMIYSDSLPPLRTLGAYNGQQAVQYIKGGLKAIYVSGWQVAGCSNTSGEVYPDQSLYPADSVPKVVYGIVRALCRADQIQKQHYLKSIGMGSGCLGSGSLVEELPTDYLVPLIADGEAGFGGILNVYELTRKMIEAGAAAIHFEDQMASEKKCGHLGGKVLVPTSSFVRVLKAARLAAEVEQCPDFLIIARTDAESATWISSDVDQINDSSFIEKETARSPEGYYKYKKGLQACIARGLVYAEYADLLWFETSVPDLSMAEQFAKAIHERFPGYPLAYNCSPSFHWRSRLSQSEMEYFQDSLGVLGYRFQFVTLASFHSTNMACFSLARDYMNQGMLAYSQLQEREIEQTKNGYTSVRHQNEVGTGYFDRISEILGNESTKAMSGSTEEEQF